MMKHYIRSIFLVNNVDLLLNQTSRPSMNRPEKIPEDIRELDALRHYSVP